MLLFSPNTLVFSLRRLFEEGKLVLEATVLSLLSPHVDLIDLGLLALLLQGGSLIMPRALMTSRSICLPFRSFHKPFRSLKCRPYVNPKVAECYFIYEE